MLIYIQENFNGLETTTTNADGRIKNGTQGNQVPKNERSTIKILSPDQVGQTKTKKSLRKKKVIGTRITGVTDIEINITLVCDEHRTGGELNTRFIMGGNNRTETTPRIK